MGAGFTAGIHWYPLAGIYSRGCILLAVVCGRAANEKLGKQSVSVYRLLTGRQVAAQTAAHRQPYGTRSRRVDSGVSVA